MRPMRMSVAQVSEHMAVLTPLDREAINWWHGNVFLSIEYKAPYHLPMRQAVNIVDCFLSEGGVLARS